MPAKTLVLLSIVLARVAYAGPPQPPSKEAKQKQFIRCFREEFNPTDSQLDTLEKEIFKNTTDIQAVADELKVQTDAMEARLESVDASDSELLARFQRIAALRATLAEDHFRRMLALRAILTPEQRTKFLVCKRKLGPPGPPHE